MDTLYLKNELYHFIESASDETLQNFMRSLESRSGENHQLQTDLNRIMETHSDIKIKLNLLMAEY